MPHEQHPRGRYPSIETASSKTQLSCTFNRVVPSIHRVRNADVSKKGKGRGKGEGKKGERGKGGEVKGKGGERGW